MAYKWVEHNAQSHNEYYTLYINVERVYKRFLDGKLKDKIIYCPADGDTSNIVKYLKDNKDNIGYKQLIYTCDDMFTHEDLFEKADFIFTNPPFSLNGKLLNLLVKYNKRFLIWVNKLGVYKQEESQYEQGKWFRYDILNCKKGDITECDFLSDDGTMISAAINYLTTEKTDDENAERGDIKGKRLSDIKNIFYHNDGYVLKYVADAPIDYDGYLYVPSSVFSEKYRYLFDIIEYRQVKGICSPEGTVTFYRIKVKLKDEYKYLRF